MLPDCRAPVCFRRIRRRALQGGVVLFVVGLRVAALAQPTLSADEQAIVRYVDAHAAGYVADLEKAVLIDSATQNTEGVKRVGAFYRAQFDALGFTTRWIDFPVEMKRGGHLFAERAGTRGSRLLLIGHLDTVLPGGKFVREGDRARGSGASDMKGGDLVVVEALRALQSVGALDGTRLIVAFTGDEEAAGDPVEVARAELIAAAKRSDLALGFEAASDKTIVAGRRGSSHWELEVQGATGHSSAIFSASLGDGAIYEAARILNSFRAELAGESGLTFNAAIIAGGTEASLDELGAQATSKNNIIPQRAVVRGDLRFVSQAQLAHARERMRAIATTGNLRRTSATIKFFDRYPAMELTPANLALLDRLSEISVALGHAKLEAGDPKTRGAGDVSFVAPFLPAIDGLGASGRGAHAPNEDVDLATLPLLVQRTAILIYRLTR